MADLKKLLNENNQNIKNYIDKETTRAQSVENEIKEKYLPKSSNSNKEAYIEYANNGLELDMGGKSGISLTTGDSIDLTTNYGVIITSDVSNGGLTVNLSSGRIGNAADPIENTDLTTKQYVDKIENKIPTTTSDLTNNSDFQTSAQVAEAIANADISTKLTDYVKTNELDNYVTDSDLESTLSEYAKIENITGDIPFSHDWKDITSKPEYFDTKWELIDNKPSDIMTLNEYQEYIDQITDNTNEISSLSTGVYAAQQKADEAMLKAETAITTDINGKIQISGIEFNNNASIDYSEEYGVAIYTPNGNITLSPPSSGSIKLNGNVTIPSNCSILDENGDDRLNTSSINSADSISILSAQEVRIQGTDSALILNANEVILSASTAYPVIQLASPSGALTYSQLEIKKYQPIQGDHSSIILYNGDGKKYEIYVSEDGKLTCEEIVTT